MKLSSLVLLLMIVPMLSFASERGVHAGEEAMAVNCAGISESSPTAVLDSNGNGGEATHTVTK